MKIEIEKKMTHGEFAKYMVDKFGISSFGRELAGGDWIGSPSDRYNASINLQTAKYDDFPHSIRIDEDCVTMKTAEEITEDTVLPILIERRDFGNELTYSHYEYVRIKDIKEESSALFYIENDDLTMTLIWKNGKLVE